MSNENPPANDRPAGEPTPWQPPADQPSSAEPAGAPVPPPAEPAGAPVPSPAEPAAAPVPPPAAEPAPPAYGAPAPEATPTAAYGAAPVAAPAQPGPWNEGAPGATPAKGKNGLGLAALIVGIVALVLALIPFVSFIAWLPALVAVGLGIAGLVVKNRPKLLAGIGLGLGAVALIASIIVSTLTIIGIANTAQQTIDEIESSFAPLEPTEEETEPTDDATDDGASEGLGNLAFGDVAEFEDGIAITVSEPTPYQPTEFAAGADLAENVAFTVTITNNSTENFEPLAYSTVTSGGAAGSQIFDDGLEIAPTATILPGQSLSWTEGWSVNDATAIVFEVAPSFDYETVIFTNTQ